MKTIIGFGLLAVLGLACGATTTNDAPQGTTNAAQSTSDPGGVCTKHQCGTPEPGDCPLAACADYMTACAYGKMIHVRCVPSPNRGIGSAPADQCELIGDCSNDSLPLPENGEACDECADWTPSCVAGTPQHVGCIRLPSDYCTWTYRCE
jgi:hypothetical protein